jgi:hypothetical protein
MWDGIMYSGGANAGNLASVFNCNWTATLHYGLCIDGMNANTIITQCVMDGSSGVAAANLALLQAGSVVVTNSDFIRATNNLLISPVSPNGVFSAYFVNVFFDTSPSSSVLFTNTGNVQRIKFTNCWFSGSATGCEFASTATTLPTAIDFVNCDIFGNSSRGIYGHGVQDFSVSSSRIAGNTVAGVEMVASTGSVTKFNLQNNTIGPTAGFGANGYGVLVNAGVYGGYNVTGNDVRGNTTANISDAGTVATTDLKVVTDNMGHLLTGLVTSLGAVLTVPATTETVVLSARIPANAVQVGQVFRIKGIGIYGGTNGTPTWRVRVGSAGTTADGIADIVSPVTGAVNVRSAFEALLTIRSLGSAGTCQAEGYAISGAAVASTTLAAVATAAVNTTAPWFIDLTWSSTAATFAVQHATIEAL